MRQRPKQTNKLALQADYGSLPLFRSLGLSPVKVFLAASNFQTDNLADRSSVETMNMSTFVRKYSRYLNHKATTYQRAGFDYCRVKRGENGFIRTMTITKLMTHLPILQEQFDSLLNFDPQAHEVSNAVIYAAFVRCFQDLVKLFALYNEGIIVMLEHYFDFKKTMAREGIEVYKKYLNRCENARAYFSVAGEIGVEDQSIVDSSASGADLLQAMQGYLDGLDGKVSPYPKSPTGSKTSPLSRTPPINNQTDLLTPTNQSYPRCQNQHSIRSFGRGYLRQTPETPRRKFASRVERCFRGSCWVCPLQRPMDRYEYESCRVFDRKSFPSGDNFRAISFLKLHEAICPLLEPYTPSRHNPTTQSFLFELEVQTLPPEVRSRPVFTSEFRCEHGSRTDFRWYSLNLQFEQKTPSCTFGKRRSVRF